MRGSPSTRKTVVRLFIERTLKGEWLGFEGYIWAAQRITGLLILGFLIVHLYTLSSILTGEAAFDSAMRIMQEPIFKLGEIVLIWILLFHSLNGVRLILINLFPKINHKVLAYSISIISLIIITVSIPVIL